MATPTDWVPVINATAEAIPPGALMVVTGVDTSSGYFTVGKPAADADSRQVLVNSVAVIPGTTPDFVGSGQGTFDMRVVVGFDAADGQPAAGEVWGPMAGSWLLRKGRDGFTVLGGAGFGLVNAVRPAAESAVVVVTGPQDPVSGLYPGKRVVRDPATGSWIVQEDIWVADVGT